MPHISKVFPISRLTIQKRQHWSNCRLYLKLQTWWPWVKEDVDVRAGISPGPADAIGGHHTNEYHVPSHNALWWRYDAHGDNIVVGLYDSTSPNALTILGGEDRDVGAFTVLRTGPWWTQWQNKHQHFIARTETFQVLNCWMTLGGF